MFAGEDGDEGSLVAQGVESFKNLKMLRLNQQQHKSPIKILHDPHLIHSTLKSLCLSMLSLKVTHEAENSAQGGVHDG